MLIPTRSFGDFLLKSEMDKPAWKQVISVVPQIVSHPLNSSWDFVVVASDGVWDAVTNRELVGLVRDRISGDGGGEKKVTLALDSLALGAARNYLIDPAITSSLRGAMHRCISNRPSRFRLGWQKVEVQSIPSELGQEVELFCAMPVRCISGFRFMSFIWHV